MNTLDVLDQLRALPQVRLTRRTEAMTDVVFHGRKIASLDSDRGSVEIAVPAAKVEDVLAAHPGVRTGAIGVTVPLCSPHAARAAIALIRRRLDDAEFGWQAVSASP